MNTAGVFCGVVLLPAIGAMASVLSRPKSAEDETPSITDSPQSSQAGAANLETEIEVLRALHQVRLVDQKEEGTGVAALPAGVYGFTYSPHQSSPLFQIKMAQSFEVHKLPDAAVHLVGFVTEEVALRISVQGECLDVNLYPEPWENSYKAVSIPASRVLGSKGPSRSDGNALTLDLGEDRETIQ